MRRDKNDIKWQECKKAVFEMDKKQCLLCQCLSIPESIRFQQSIPDTPTSIIDPAHRVAVSKNIKLMYDPNNVFSICRCHHERLDNCKNPITGKPCSSEDIEYWWNRILKKRKENLEERGNRKHYEFYYEEN